MNEEKFKEILERYYKGLANKNEFDLVEKYFEKFRYLNTSSKEIEKNKKEVKQKVFTAIKSQKHIHFHDLLKVAAAFALLVVSVFFTVEIIRKSEKVETTVIKSETGERRIVVLPDGSKVKLNSSSAISFDQGFGKSHRNLNFSGEAYFDVFHRPELPFIVKSNNEIIRVLGTIFNIKSTGKHTEVVLVEGKVNVQDVTNGKSFTLQPGERLNYDTRKSSYIVSNTEIQKHISWVDNRLYFENEKLNIIVKKLEEWYGKKIILSDQDLGNCKVTLLVDNESLESVLTNLTYTSNISFSKKDNTYKILGKGCN
ncbi:MAG: FecR family protein [Cyclobacteriaceae bacterium]